MAWESRGGQQYYYRKVWEDGTCRSEYVGTGPLARIAARLDAVERRRRHALRREHRALIERERTVAQELDGVEELVRTAAAAVLLVSGYHTHKRQWRRRNEGT